MLRHNNFITVLLEGRMDGKAGKVDGRPQKTIYTTSDREGGSGQ